jgi:hypothetical protein
MTTKPKTRKASAAKAAARQDAAPEQSPENEISKLIARWNYLEADRKYQATIAATKAESDNLFRYLHGGEKGEIKSKLANLVPKNFEEVYDLFDFAVAATLEKVSTRENAQTEIKMLNALRRGIFHAQTSEWARLMVENVRGISEAQRKVAEFPEIRT